MKTTIPDAAHQAAEAAYRETLTELRLSEGGGFKVSSQNRRALQAALEAAAPHMQGEAWESGYTLGYADCANKQESNRPNPHKEEV